ncbi:MAG: hypothetical protein ACXABK_05510, partial [Candidatus Heimdallarchaeaceae archaeon]
MKYSQTDNTEEIVIKEEVNNYSMNDETLFRQGITLFSGYILAFLLSVIYSGTIYFRIYHGASGIQISRMSTAISNTLDDFVFLAFLILILLDYFS